jgi:hypothetical protein
VRIDVGHEMSRKIGTDLDTIQLSIFSHRFMSIAGGTGDQCYDFKNIFSEIFGKNRHSFDLKY